LVGDSALFSSRNEVGCSFFSGRGTLIVVMSSPMSSAKFKLCAFIYLRFNFPTRFAIFSKLTLALSIFSVGFNIVDADVFMANLSYKRGYSCDKLAWFLKRGDTRFLVVGEDSSPMVRSLARLRFFLSINRCLSWSFCITRSC